MRFRRQPDTSGEEITALRRQVAALTALVQASETRALRAEADAAAQTTAAQTVRQQLDRARTALRQYRALITEFQDDTVEIVGLQHQVVHLESTLATAHFRDPLTGRMLPQGELPNSI